MPGHNYKQKWIQALEQHRTDVVETATLKVAKADDASREVSDAILVLNQTRGMVGQLSLQCKSLITECDEMKSVGGVEFQEMSHEVDTKLSSLPIPIALRRVRDVIKIAEARIAILSLQCEDLFLANKKYESTLDRVLAQKQRLHRTLIETQYIGDSPTANELEDYKDAPDSYLRHGLHYEDLDENWTDTMLTRSTVIRTANPKKDNGYATSEDEEESDAEIADDTPTKNRLARIQPASPSYTRKNDL